MSESLSPLCHSVSALPPLPTAVTLTLRPSLWQALDPARQQALASCLAELMRRLRAAPIAANAEGISDEPS